MKEKIDAGATRAITQFFFNPDDYFEFLDDARNIGITVPIVAGILPIGQFAQAKRFADMCGAKIPGEIADKFDGLEEKPEERAKVAIDVASDICTKLLAGGVDQLHFYTLNRADLTQGIVKNIQG